MQRREVLVGLGATAAAAVVTSAFAQDHSHHQGTAINQAVINSASECVSTGEVCLNLCNDVLAQGDKSMADCAKSVSQLVVVCGALRSLAAQNAPALPKMARVAMDVCQDCEAQCRKHEKMHAECKACADACATCYAECKKAASA